MQLLSVKKAITGWPMVTKILNLAFEQFYILGEICTVCRGRIEASPRRETGSLGCMMSAWHELEKCEFAS